MCQKPIIWPITFKTIVSSQSKYSPEQRGVAVGVVLLLTFELVHLDGQLSLVVESLHNLGLLIENVLSALGVEKGLDPSVSVLCLVRRVELVESDQTERNAGPLENVGLEEGDGGGQLGAVAVGAESNVSSLSKSLSSSYGVSEHCCCVLC